LFFYLTAAFFNNIFIRAILVYSLSFFEPFGFNWLKMDLPLINTYYNTYESKINRKSLNIYMPQYNINQTDKWNKNNFESIISKYIQDIDYAIKNKYDLIILPETAIPSVLNTHQELLTLLKEKSQNISIVTGALSLENNQYLNSTYMFEKGSIQIANKVVLVPFGESIPLPNFLRDFINDVFFDGASDYQSAREATTFNIMNVKYRNAICWEATTDTIYENLDTKNIIVTSNNAWFVPSIEPVLQNLLLKYYAKKYDLTIYHSSNKSPNSIIRGDSIKKYN
jgi:apolipoprotein N-acyltransferase